MYENEMKNKNKQMNENPVVREPIHMLSRAKIKVLNEKRYDAMLYAAYKLSCFLKETMEEGEVIAEVLESHNAGVVSAEMDDLMIEDMRAFVEMLEGANGFKLCRSENGKLRLSIVFHSVLSLVKWTDEEM